MIAVKQDGAAEAAGLKAGDTWVEVNGVAVETSADVRKTLDPKRTNKVVVKRDALAAADWLEEQV